MSDRTSVTLTVLSINADEVEGILEQFDNWEEKQSSTSIEGAELIEYSIHDVANGQLEAEHCLKEHGICYDIEIFSACNIDPSSIFNRYDQQGKHYYKEYRKGNEGMIDLESVLKANEKGCLSELLRDEQHLMKVLSWDYQASRLRVN